MEIKKGIIYVATGVDYLKEAEISAESVKNNTDLKTAVFTDIDVSSPFFDKVIKIDDPRYDSGDKIKQIGKTPFKKTLFLDTDTYICSDISSLFKILEKYDVAAPYAPNRVNSVTLDRVPESIPEMNTGVFLFKKNANFEKLLDEWRKRYVKHRKNNIVLDQPSFRESVYFGKIKIHILPPEYNLRFGKKSVGYVGGKVKILHGRRGKMILKKFCKKINKKSENRVWVIRGDNINIETHNMSVQEKILEKINYKSIKRKIKKMFFSN